MSALANKSGQKYFFRIVPLVNIVYSAWSIVAEVREFVEKGDKFFFCTLDYRDALTTEAPDVVSLAFQVAEEAAFGVL